VDVTGPLAGVPATYHGAGFRPRRATHGADLLAGHPWTRCGVDSEWMPLRAVVLAGPPPGAEPPSDPDAVQHVRPVDYARLADQVAELAGVYRLFGVTVHLLPDVGPCPAELPAHNRMFVRDTFAATPEGVVLGRMGSEVRAAEPPAVAALLASLGVPLLRTVHGPATLEGADVLWPRPDLALVGLGNRTNAAGARQLADTLRVLGVTCRGVRLPRGVQHLLGLVQFVDRDLALVRHRLAGTGLLGLLRELGFRTVEFDEGPEVGDGFGMNVVCVAPRAVVMPTGAPTVRKRLRETGVDVVAEVEVGELLAAAGGIGCATGVLSREWIAPGGRPPDAPPESAAAQRLPSTSPLEAGNRRA
jgi:N-dimethylarginine dimethylaminohydrolase